MRLTRAGEYAVRCVRYLAEKGKGELISRKEIAEQADIPTHFLAKIAQQLAKAGIIEIQQGAAGGYRLIVAPEDLTLLEVIEAIIGEISLNDCVTRPGTCLASNSCTVHKIWNKARQQLRDTLREADFATLVAEEDACCLSSFPKGTPATQKKEK